MRPTFIRLIAGGALGAAFSISLTLPGSVVFPGEPPIRQLAAPEAPAATVLHAAPVIQLPRKAPTKPRVVAQRVYVPAAGTVRTTSVVRHTPPRPKPLKRPPAPVARPVTPLAARPAPPAAEPSDEPNQAEERGDEEPRKADHPRKSEQPKKAHNPRKPEKPKQARKPKDHGSAKKEQPSGAHKEHRDDQGDDRGTHDNGKHGSGRGDGGDHG